jgi:hypothetical protein
VSWLLVLLCSCNPGDPFPAGSWRLASWSVQVGPVGAPELEESRDDAGFAVLEGDGDFWESVAYVELPLYVDEPVPVVVPQHAWVYWTYQHAEPGRPPELWFAWYQAYGTPPGVIVLSAHEADRLEGDASYQLGSTSVGLTDVRTHWVFEREKP